MAKRKSPVENFRFVYGFKDTYISKDIIDTIKTKYKNQVCFIASDKIGENSIKSNAKILIYIDFMDLHRAVSHANSEAINEYFGIKSSDDMIVTGYLGPKALLEWFDMRHSPANLASITYPLTTYDDRALTFIYDEIHNDKNRVVGDPRDHEAKKEKEAQQKKDQSWRPFFDNIIKEYIKIRLESGYDEQEYEDEKKKFMEFAIGKIYEKSSETLKFKDLHECLRAFKAFISFEEKG